MTAKLLSFVSDLRGFVRALRHRPAPVQHSGTDLARMLDEATHVGDGVAALGAPINGPDVQADTVAIGADRYVASLDDDR